MSTTRSLSFLATVLASCLIPTGCGSSNSTAQKVPAAIQEIMDKPAYRGAEWGLHVVDLDSGKVIHDAGSGRPLLVGSLRKLFSVGVALDALGPEHTFHTPVHRRGDLQPGGVLAGDLILVASGDLAMGGRTNADGSFAISSLDHNEANALGNATLTVPDPLAGFNALAAQVAAAGIRRVTGDVIIDDRLFEPFKFRDDFDIRPIFVNDNAVDVIITPPAAPGARPTVDWRPKSAAFQVESDVAGTAAGNPFVLDLEPELPDCIGQRPCVGKVTGSLPADFIPPLNREFPLVRTFRIVQPANYARTVFIEALARAGVSVDAEAVAPNPAQNLPPAGSYTKETRVAELVSAPYRDFAKHILKVSYNIGADTSLMLFGLTRRERTISGALAAERQTLADAFGIPASQTHFVDGAGGGDTRATTQAVATMLQNMYRNASFPAFFDGLPLLGMDGSLALVNAFETDPSLAGAKGQVRAKTGTLIEGSAQGPVLRAQALAGYIQAKSGRNIGFVLVVNEGGPLEKVEDVLNVFQDQGTISAILWKSL